MARIELSSQYHKCTLQCLLCIPTTTIWTSCVKDSIILDCFETSDKANVNCLLNHGASELRFGWWPHLCSLYCNRNMPTNSKKNKLHVSKVVGHNKSNTVVKNSVIEHVA